jgi:AcrR family transcriptional regulator
MPAPDHSSACATWRPTRPKGTEPMPRPAKYDEGKILSIAASLVAERGPAAASMTAIAAAAGAPSGSIYHRFRTRDTLLGRLWLDKATFFQDRAAAALADPDPREAALKAALSIPQASREDLDGARIMLLHRREDFVTDAWPEPILAEAARLRRQLGVMFSGIAVRLFGQATPEAVEVAVFAITGVPMAAIRHHLQAGHVPPERLDVLIAAAHRAVVAEAVATLAGRGRQP